MQSSHVHPTHSPSPARGRNTSLPTNSSHILETDDDDSDLEDLTVYAATDNDILASDPLNRTTPSASRSSYPFGLSLPTFHGHDIADGPPTPITPITPTSPGGGLLRRRHTPVLGQGESSNYFGDVDGADDSRLPDEESKEPNTSSVDWYTEGPGRRVGYEDLTAIDWIFEYAKERQRVRVLYSSTTGALGQLLRLLDASQIWLVLVCTGIVTGAVAAMIDVVSDWLGDLKQGVCRAGQGGGKFYLNKTFCCWGLDGE